MTGRARLVLFLAGAVVFAALFGSTVWRLPHFGSAFHPYGDRAVDASVGREHTANTVMSVTFDQRGTDTFGEEVILFASVLGAGVLLRPREDEERDPAQSRGRAQDTPDDGAVLTSGWLVLPVAVLVGLFLVAHGHLSPGGGFQGGVTLASALHLVYLAGNYPAFERMRPEGLYHVTDAAGALAYAVLGAAVMVTGAAFLANVLPKGQLTSLVSAGTVPVLDVAVGVEVGSAFILIIAAFLEQTLAIRQRPAEASDE